MKLIAPILALVFASQLFAQDPQYLYLEDSVTTDEQLVIPENTILVATGKTWTFTGDTYNTPAIIVKKGASIWGGTFNMPDSLGLQVSKGAELISAEFNCHQINSYACVKGYGDFTARHCKFRGGRSSCITLRAGNVTLENCLMEGYDHHGVGCYPTVTATVVSCELHGADTDGGSAFRNSGHLFVRDVGVTGVALLKHSQQDSGNAPQNPNVTTTMMNVHARTSRRNPSISVISEGSVARFIDVDVNGWVWCYGGDVEFTNSRFDGETGKFRLATNLTGLRFSGCDFGQVPVLVENNIPNSSTATVEIKNCRNIPPTLTQPNRPPVTIKMVGTNHFR